DTALQWNRGNDPVMLLPPGEYQVAIRPHQFDSLRLVWPDRLRVKEGEETSLSLGTGIQIVGPKGSRPDFLFHFVDQATGQAVQEGRQTWAAQLVPPGTYKVEVATSQFDPWQPLAANVVVEKGKFTEVPLKELPRPKR